MTLQINLLSPKITFNFTGNKPATKTFEAANAVEDEEQNERSCDPSRSVSEHTLVDQDSDLEPTESATWIAGVGDICNSTSQDHIIHKGNSRYRTTQVKLPSNTLPPVPAPHSHHLTPTKRSALRRHCDFWDTNQDGLIYPWDIFTGFRRLGFNIFLCLWAAVTMSIASSYGTQPTWLPHPLFVINLKNMNANRHGSTTGAYDLDAELDLRRFDAIFKKYAGGKGYLTAKTMYDVWAGQCCANDWFGWFAEGLEWIAMYILLWPRDGKMHKEDVKGVYDGSIFWKIAESRAQAREG